MKPVLMNEHNQIVEYLEIVPENIQEHCLKKEIPGIIRLEYID